MLVHKEFVSNASLAPLACCALSLTASRFDCKMLLESLQDLHSGRSSRGHFFSLSIRRIRTHVSRSLASKLESHFCWVYRACVELTQMRRPTSSGW